MAALSCRRRLANVRFATDTVAKLPWHRPTQIFRPLGAAIE
jgi:hypothetical protein